VNCSVLHCYICCWSTVLESSEDFLLQYLQSGYSWCKRNVLKHFSKWESCTSCQPYI
jgi:hypothetical protein